MSSLKDKHIGVLMGGISEEREISLRTGEAIYAALKKQGYLVSKIIVDRDVDVTLRKTTIDMAFIALHGTYGEDGCIQGLLELRGIPYTGSGVLASALCMNKAKSKELFRLHNIPTAPYYLVRRDQLASYKKLHEDFAFPVFVKPNNQGSSVGGSRAQTLEELKESLELAAKFDHEILVERFVPGREVTIGVLHGKALGAIEIEPKREFYDYKAKYEAGQSEYHFPARLSQEHYDSVLALAEKANACLGVTGVSRVDTLVTEGGNTYVLEVNTMPGMTSESSLVPKIAAGLGFSFEELCVAILEGIPLAKAQQSKAQTKVSPAAVATL
ncbi:MAG: D-alanine--D-alanine ligase [Myxococcales bacterium]|nr:MAG: D-alanine--D-alanine ligase [Myxococcales bacterium]